MKFSMLKNKFKHSNTIVSEKPQTVQTSTQTEVKTELKPMVVGKSKVSFYDFCGFMDNLYDSVLFNKYEQKLLDKNNPELSYKFCKEVDRAHFDKHSKIVLASKNDNIIFQMAVIWLWGVLLNNLKRHFNIAPYCAYFQDIVKSNRLEEFYDKYDEQMINKNTKQIECSRLGQLLATMIRTTDLKKDAEFVKKVADFYLDKKLYAVACCAGAYVPGFLDEHLSTILINIDKIKKIDYETKRNMYKGLLNTLKANKVDSKFIDKSFEYIASTQNNAFILELLDTTHARPQPKEAINNLIDGMAITNEQYAREFIWNYARLCDDDTNDRKNFFNAPSFKKIYDVIAEDCDDSSHLENIISWIRKDYDTTELVDKIIQQKGLHDLLYSTIQNVQPHLVPKIQTAIQELIVEKYQTKPDSAGFDIDRLLEDDIRKLLNTDELSKTILRVNDPYRSAKFVCLYPDTEDYEKHVKIVQMMKEQTKSRRDKEEFEYRLQEMADRRAVAEKQKDFLKPGKDDLTKIDSKDIEFVL